MSENKITEEKLKEAREKLACHILPPGAHAETPEEETAGSSCGTSPDCAVSAEGKVRLTQMTSAGG